MVRQGFAPSKLARGAGVAQHTQSRCRSRGTRAAFVRARYRRSQRIPEIELVRMLDYIPVADSETVRLDGALLQDILVILEHSRTSTRETPSVRVLVETDGNAHDAKSLSRVFACVYPTKRSSLRRRRTREGPSAYGKPSSKRTHGSWASVSLALTSCDEATLEQTVAGFSVTGSGKRADTLMMTNGRIGSLVFAEIKHDKTRLLGNTPYRRSVDFLASSTFMAMCPPRKRKRGRDDARRC